MTSATASRNGKPRTADPPHAEQAEADIVASLLLMPELITDVRAIVGVEDFYKPHHATIARAIFAIADKGEPVSATTVFDYLIAQNERPIADCLEELVDRLPHGAHAVYHAKQVRDASIKRRLFYRSEDLKQAALDPMLTAEDLVTFTDGLTAWLSHKDPDRFRMMTAAELAAGDFAGRYIIENILASLEFGIMVGPKKGLKTTLALYMACCIVLGRPLFGIFRVSQRMKVGFFSGESGRGTLQDAMRRIGEHFGRTAGDFEELKFCFEVPKLDCDADIASVKRIIMRDGLQVVFLDCFYRMLGEASDDVANLFKMGMLLGKLMDLQRETGCTIILLHHCPKHAPYAEPELDNAAYAGSAEACRQFVLLARRAKYEPGSGHHELWFSVGGSMGHSEMLALDIDEGSQKDPGGRRFELTTISASAARADAAAADDVVKEENRKSRKQTELESDRDNLLGILRTMPKPDTRTEVRNLVGVSGPRFSRAAISLIEDGHVMIASQVVPKGNNRFYDAYWLTSRKSQLPQPSAPVSTGQPDADGCVASHQSTPSIEGLTDASACDACDSSLTDAKADRCETEGEA
jgi:replicative DNA helicase